MEVEKLEVWQAGVELTEKVYKITSKFPESEKYGIVDQMKRSALSIPSNIAEGKGRNTYKELINALHYSKGYLCELETQCIIAWKVGYLNDKNMKLLRSMCEQMEKQINDLIRGMRSKRRNKHD